MRNLIAGLVALSVVFSACAPNPPPAGSIEPGEELRIRQSEEGSWSTGSLVSYDSATLILHEQGEDRVHDLLEADRIEWYERRDLVPELLIGVASGIAGWWIANEIVCDDQTQDCEFSGSDVAVGAGVGLGFSALDYAIRPGYWRDATATLKPGEN